jgi:hypothetical protein
MSQPYVQISLTARRRREDALSSDSPLARFKTRPQTGQFTFEVGRASVGPPVDTFAPIFLIPELTLKDLDPFEEFAIRRKPLLDGALRITSAPGIQLDRKLTSGDGANERDEDQQHTVEREHQELAREDETILEGDSGWMVGSICDDHRDQGRRGEREGDDDPDRRSLPRTVFRVTRQGTPERVEDASNRAPDDSE